MVQQTNWAERNAARQAYLGMPGLFKGKREFQLFPYGPEPSEFDRYGQYAWFYGGWYIIWLSTIVSAAIIILDLVLYLHPAEAPDRKSLALSVVPVSRAPTAADTLRMTSGFGFQMTDPGVSILECYGTRLDDDRRSAAKENLAKRETRRRRSRGRRHNRMPRPAWSVGWRQIWPE